jgi:hypothetical protein
MSFGRVRTFWSSCWSPRRRATCATSQRSLDFNLFGLQEDFNEYKEEVELFLDDELGCSTLEAARAEAGEAGWVKLPASVDRYDAEQLLKEFGDSNLELLDLLDAVKELSHE